MERGKTRVFGLHNIKCEKQTKGNDVCIVPYKTPTNIDKNCRVWRLRHTAKIIRKLNGAPIFAAPYKQTI